MAGSLRRRRGAVAAQDYWPGFVDATATLLLLIVFLLAVFAAGTYLLSRETGDKDRTLISLRAQIGELARLLALERSERTGLEENLLNLRQTISQQEQEQTRLLQQRASEKDGRARERVLEDQLSREQEIAAQAAAAADLLNQQIASLRAQLGAVQAALDASEVRDRESRARIVELGKRLNTALAQKVQELTRHRSSFLAALRKVLGEKEGFEIVGDRFVLRSEVLFDSGSANVSPRGIWELRQIAEAVVEAARDIPDDIDWILRIDGHTDTNAISTVQFPSNWHLSVARALAVVDFLIERGVPPKRLVAAGFGEFWPLNPEDTPEAWARNRRIEMKLTSR